MVERGPNGWTVEVGMLHEILTMFFQLKFRTSQHLTTYTQSIELEALVRRLQFNLHFGGGLITEPATLIQFDCGSNPTILDRMDFPVDLDHYVDSIHSTFFFL